MIFKQNMHMAGNFAQLTKNSTKQYTVSMHVLAVHCHLDPWGINNGIQRQIKFLPSKKKNKGGKKEEKKKKKA